MFPVNLRIHEVDGRRRVEADNGQPAARGGGGGVRLGGGGRGLLAARGAGGGGQPNARAQRPRPTASPPEL